MRLQRVRAAGSRIEMQADKWTVEGAVKSPQARVFSNAAPALRVRNVSAFCVRAPVYGEARWYRRYKYL